jgi:hypothetical protein
MIHVLVRHNVSDYGKWKSVFDADLEFRHKGGELNCRIFHNTDNLNDLTLLFEWENLEQAQQYMSSKELRDKMKQAGVASTPEIQFLGEMYTIRRTAAD